MKWIFLNLLSIILGIGSLVLAYKGIDGWGWFLFAALVAYYYGPSESYSGDDEED